MRWARARKWLLMLAGMLAMAAGAVGVFVPVLPTTPFLLLSAACFFRSSDRFYRWLVGNKWLGMYIRNYRERRAITPRSKAAALILLWAGIGYSACKVDHWWLRVFLGAVAIGISVHLLRLKTLRMEQDRLVPPAERE